MLLDPFDLLNGLWVTLLLKPLLQIRRKNFMAQRSDCRWVESKKLDGLNKSSVVVHNSPQIGQVLNIAHVWTD
jgi:hypothetical protein